MNAAPAVNTPPVTAEAYDPAIVAAWRRFLDYDVASYNQKTLYQRIRTAIIFLSLLTSVGAVLSIYVSNAPGFNIVFQQPLRIALIIMPIASVALMNYAAQFSTSTGWVEYRVSAEMIRTQIYLYRLKVPPYRDLNPYDKRVRLLDEVASVDTWMRQHNLPMPQMQNLSDTDMISRIAGKTEGDRDDGFAPLEIQQYIKWRVENQVSWYTGKIEQDYQTMRNNRLSAIIVSAIGSVLAGIGGGLEGLVGITTAVGTALTTSSDVRMYGRTYRLYHEAAFDLKQLLNRWQTLPPDKRDAAYGDYVLLFEKVFDTERSRWREDTIRAQISTEQAIYSQVQQVAGSQADSLLANQKNLPSSVMDRPTVFSPTQTEIKVEVPGEVVAEVSHTGGSPATVTVTQGGEPAPAEADGAVTVVDMPAPSGDSSGEPEPPSDGGHG